ncbi:unnamed protein product, partial [Closterium sp. NIES-53]
APKAPAEPAAYAREEVRTQFRAAHIAYKRGMAQDAAATLAIRLHLLFDQRANFRQVPSAHAMYSAAVRRYSPPPHPAVLGCLALPLTFPALSDLITVANEGSHSGAGGSGGGGHQELEPSFSASDVFASSTTVFADFGGRGVVGGGDAGGAGSGGAASGGSRSPLVGGVGGTGTGGAGAGGAGSGGTLQSLPRRPIFLEQPSSSLPEPTPTCTTPPLLFLPPDSPLPAPARYVPLSVSLTGRREPASCAASPAPSHVTREPIVILLPPPSSLPAVSDLARAACATIPCCLVALVTAPASSPAAACALVAELAGFAATCRSAYLAGLVFASSCPPSVGGELALGCDVLGDRQFELEYLPYPLSIRTRYVAPGRHHPAHWWAARRVLRYLVRLVSRM